MHPGFTAAAGETEAHNGWGMAHGSVPSWMISIELVAYQTRDGQHSRLWECESGKQIQSGNGAEYRSNTVGICNITNFTNF